MTMGAHGTCNICGHPLTDPESIERGVGPDCWAKLRSKTEAAEDSDTTNYMPLMADGSVMLRRDKAAAERTWVGIGKRVLVDHSPTGLEWGYNGSAPADLALNVLFIWTGDYDIAVKYHQEFKRKFVAQVPYDGGILNKAEGMAWLEEARRSEANLFATTVEAEPAPDPTPITGQEVLMLEELPGIQPTAPQQEPTEARTAPNLPDVAPKGHIADPEPSKGPERKGPLSRQIGMHRIDIELRINDVHATPDEVRTLRLTPQQAQGIIDLGRSLELLLS